MEDKSLRYALEWLVIVEKDLERTQFLLESNDRNCLRILFATVH